MIQSRLIIAASIVVIGLIGLFYLWPTTNDTPAATAQEVVGGACAKIEAQDSYDVSAVISDTSGGGAQSILWDIQVSGNDYHLTLSYADATSTSEYLWINGVGYTRHADYGNTWQRSETAFHDVTSAFAGLGNNPLCPSSAQFRSTGTTTSTDGQSLRRYTDSPAGGGQPTFEPDPVIPGLTRAVTHTISVDARGNLTQLQMDTQTHLDGQTGSIRMDATFSGIGEANTITAPVVSGQ